MGGRVQKKPWDAPPIRGNPAKNGVKSERYALTLGINFVTLRLFIINYSFIITCTHLCFFVNNTALQVLFTIKWQKINFLIFWKKKAAYLFIRNLKENTWKKNSLTYKSQDLNINIITTLYTSQQWYNTFFKHIFYLSAYYFKFVFGLQRNYWQLISIAHKYIQ